MQTRFTFPASGRDDALETASRLAAFVVEGNDRLQVLDDCVHLETTDPVRVVGDLVVEGFLEAQEA
jgi:hypothetical protein